MGATNEMSPVDVDKFGQDLETVVKKISALEPSVVVTSDLSGEHAVRGQHKSFSSNFSDNTFTTIL